jgi:hypothetical protein
MKSTQFLSVVFSLIMFTGVTAGNTAFADSDDLDDILEDYCELTLDERSDIIEKYELDEFAEKLAIICEIEDDDEREESLDNVIDAIDLEVFDETDDDDRYEDNFDLDDLLDRYCELNDEDKRQLLADHPRLAPFTDRLANYCDLSEDEQDAIDDLIKEHGDKIRHELKAYSDEYSNKGSGNPRDHFAMYCDMTVEERAEKMEAKHDDLSDDLRADMVRYCEMSEDEQDDFRDIMMDRMDELHDSMKDKMMDRPQMDYKKDMRMMLDRYCDMTDVDKKAFVAEHDKAEDHVDKMNRFCALTDEDSRMDFIMEHKGEYMKHMKDKVGDKMHDKMTNHMDYDRLCDMEDSDRANEITDVAKLDRISKWCEMTPEERKDYKKEHHDEFKDKVHDKVMDKVHDKMKLSDKSDRIKAMIMDKRDISDERRDEIKMKYIEKHGDLTDDRKSELKMKFKDHMRHMKIQISDERKSSIQDRVAEMKAFKAELRERSSEMTDEEKQKLRSEFIEKAKDMQLAWINPRVQMTAGIDAAEVQCREGFSLVMKASNGVAMCLKADTALKMIDRGIIVPAN